MDPITFRDNFGTMAEAPGGIDGLRAMILNLATRGKLVPQDPEDESAPSILAQFDDGDLVTSSKLTEPITLRNLPWELPRSWCWARLKQIADFSPGKTPPTKEEEFWADDQGIAWATIADMPASGVLMETSRRVTPAAADRIFKSEPVPAGTLLMSFKLTIGKVCWLGIDAYFNEAIISIRTPYQDLAEFLFRTLPQLAGAGASKNAIKGSTLNKTSLTNLLIPLPPRSEQRRIVEKVDELMALCDDLEARQQSRNQATARLRASALDALATVDIAEELAAAWQRIHDNWDALADDPDAIAEISQAAVDLAVTGMLGAHRPLGAVERFDLGDLVEMQNGFAFKSSWYTASGVALVRCQNITHGSLRWDDRRCVTKERAAEFDRFRLNEGDIVLALDRPLISTGLKVARIQPSDLPALLLQRVARLTIRDDRLTHEFLWLWLHSTAFLQALDPGRSKGVPHISTKQLASVAITIPSREAQLAAACALKKILPLCDELEDALARRNTAQETLAAALAHHVASGYPPRSAGATAEPVQ